LFSISLKRRRASLTELTEIGKRGDIFYPSGREPEWIKDTSLIEVVSGGRLGYLAGR